MKRFGWLVLAALVPSAPAWGYVDASPSLGKVIHDAATIVVLRVEKVSVEKRAIRFKKVADLKGNHPAAEVKHQLTDRYHPREARTILEWVAPGQFAVCFLNGKVAVLCTGFYWYECSALEPPWWKLVNELEDPQAPVRGAAVDDLGLIGRPARSAVPSLVKLFADLEPLVRVKE